LHKGRGTTQMRVYNTTTSLAANTDITRVWRCTFRYTEIRRRAREETFTYAQHASSSHFRKIRSSANKPLGSELLASCAFACLYVYYFSVFIFPLILVYNWGTKGLHCVVMRWRRVGIKFQPVFEFFEPLNQS
jgi:hypothetical protein